MQVCRLTHKTRKELTVEKIITATCTAADIKREWRYKYGKLFFDCDFVVEGVSEKYRNTRVEDVDSGIIFDNPSEASKSAGVSIFTVYNHIHKKLHGKKRGFYYRFKFAS